MERENQGRRVATPDDKPVAPIRGASDSPWVIIHGNPTPESWVERMLEVGHKHHGEAFYDDFVDTAGDEP